LTARIVISLVLAAGLFFSGYFLGGKKPAQILTITNTKLLTNTEIKYKYIDVTKTNIPPACIEYVDDYNHVLKLYKEYTGCTPVNARTVKTDILFELTNTEITNSYDIQFKIDEKKIKWYLMAGYSLKQGAGIGAMIGYKQFGGGLMLRMQDIDVNGFYSF
jgi:hypothetical protein